MPSDASLPLEPTYFWVAVPMARPCPEGPQAAPLSRWAAASCQSLNPSACPVSSLFLCQPVLSSPFLASAPSFSKLFDQFEVSELLLSTFIPNPSSPALPSTPQGAVGTEPHPFHSPGHSIKPKPHIRHRDEAAKLHMVSDMVT